MMNFLKLDGIPGGSVEAEHRDWITIKSFSFTENQPSSYGSGGTSVGRISMSDFTFQTESDPSTPMIFLACATGQHLKSAELQCCDRTGLRLQFRFSDLVISSFSIGDQNPEAPVAVQFSLSFGKIEVTYVKRQADGQSAGNVVTGWDLAANRKV